MAGFHESKKLFTSVLSLLVPFTLLSQNEIPDDTVRIDEIIVRGTHLSSALNGFRHSSIDTSVINYYALESLSDLISGNSHIFIKDYGPGGIATASFRGTGAVHTQVYWNNFNINSPMPGQSDLSLIPSSLIDGIDIFHGNASISLGSGGFGGIIEIETRPEWKKRKNILTEFGTGSFGQYSGMMKVRAGSENFQLVTKIAISTAENDFPYLNTVSYAEPLVEKRQNAGFATKDFMQEIFLRKERSTTSLSVWYQATSRNLPSNILVYQAERSEKQADESLRAVLSRNMYFNNTSIEASVAWFFNRLDYQNEPADIDSRNKSGTLFIRGKLETSFRELTKFIMTWNNETDFVKSNNYKNSTTRNISTFTGIVQRDLGKRLNSSLLVREIIDDNKLLSPDFSTGIGMYIDERKNRIIKINFSRNSRVPSLNDLFWNPGGNTELKNEYSYSGEMSFSSSDKILQSLELNSELTFFAGTIRDMIQWRPGEYSYWTPVNIGRVNTSGIESGLILVYKVSRLNVRLNGEYTYNRAYILNDDVKTYERNRLIYVPENMFNGGIKVILNKYYAGFNTCYTGRRFTDADNTRYLPYYSTTSLMTGIRVRSGVHSFDLCFKSENIFGKKFEVMAYYPMPGRSFLLSIKYQFNETK